MGPSPGHGSSGREVGLPQRIEAALAHHLYSRGRSLEQLPTRCLGAEIKLLEAREWPRTGPEQAPNRPRDEARKLEPSPDVLYRLLHPHGGCSGSRSAVANVFALAARQRDIIYNALSILLARIAGELWGLSGHNGRCLSSWEERPGRRTRLQLLLANS